MIDQAIKDKLNLKPSDKQTGESFINNCEVMIIPALSILDNSVYLMGCNREGKPLQEQHLCLYTSNSDRSMYVAKGFFFDCPVEEIFEKLNDMILNNLQ
jgi:hypothetical protein